MPPFTSGCQQLITILIISDYSLMLNSPEPARNLNGRHMRIGIAARRVKAFTKDVPLWSVCVDPCFRLPLHHPGGCRTLVLVELSRQTQCKYRNGHDRLCSGLCFHPFALWACCYQSFNFCPLLCPVRDGNWIGLFVYVCSGCLSWVEWDSTEALS